MCLESVFSALGGWLLLNQSLSLRESAGCALIFAAVVLSQLPLEELRGCKRARDAAGGRGIPYELTRKKVKYFNLHVPAGRFCAPQLTSAHIAGGGDHYIIGQMDWIRAAQARQAAREAAGVAARQGCRAGPLHGHER